MVQVFGYKQIPYSMIVWMKDGMSYSKTVCYSSEDEKRAIERMFTSGDFYSQFEEAAIYRKNNQNKIIKKVG